MFFFLVVLLLCIMYASTYSPNVCVVYTPTIRFRRENKTFTRISKTRCAPAQESNSGWQRIQSAGISFIPSIHTARILQTQLGTSRGRHPYSQNLEKHPAFSLSLQAKNLSFSWDVLRPSIHVALIFACVFVGEDVFLFVFSLLTLLFYLRH
jgi:hypothetical protein